MTDEQRDAKLWRILMIMIDEDQVRPMVPFCRESGLDSEELTERVEKYFDKEIE